MNAAECERFRERADDLALGHLEDPERSELLEHAFACPSCQSHLIELSVVADRLLAETPEIEPPPGFEDRVLARIAASRGASASRNRNLNRLRYVGAAVFLVALGTLGGYLWGRVERPSAQAVATELHAVRRGAIVGSDGAVAGSVIVIDRPRPLVLMTMNDMAAGTGGTGQVKCQLGTADGRTVVIGSYMRGGMGQGAWALGIGPELTEAVHLTLLNADGSVAGWAKLT